MKPLQLFDPASSTYTYILFDPATREALIIDPVDEQLDRDLAVLRDHGLRLVWAVETHAHADHITSAGRLAELAGARLAAPRLAVARRFRGADSAVDAPDTLTVRLPESMTASPADTSAAHSATS